MSTYSIVRHYADNDQKREVLRTGLSLEEARGHCNDPETSSSTCESEAAQAITRAFGPWFDAYHEE